MTSPMSSGASSVGTVSTMASFSPVGSVGGYWTSPSNTASYGYNSAPANPSYSSNAPNSSFGGMRGFSGNGGPLSINRGNSRPSSPATGELVPQSTHYEGTASSFSGGMPMTTAAGVHPISASAGSGLPSIGQGPGVHSYPAAYASAGSTSHPPINSQSQPQDPYSPQGSLPPPHPLNHTTANSIALRIRHPRQFKCRAPIGWSTIPNSSLSPAHSTSTQL